MPGILTRKFRIHNAEQFYESLTETQPSRYYVFIGRVTAWNNENTPPTPTDTVQDVSFDGFRDMIAFKRIQSSDVSHCIPRYNWTSGNVYREFSDTNASLFPTTLDPASANTFYVLTEDNNVYKCIDNNLGTASTYKPTGVSTGIIITSDNYRWKFMYRISAATSLKFLTSNYMPAAYLESDDNSAQWDVQSTAANGAIVQYTVGANGSGYLSSTNTFALVTNSTVMRLATTESGTDDIFNGSTVYVSAGLGAGQIRTIVNYVGATKTITTNSAFTSTPNTSSTYIIGPRVIVRGDSGSSVAIRATAYVSNCAGGQVRKVSYIASGSGYSSANVTVSANTSHGSGASVTPVISPRGGHGSDAIDELAAHNIMISVQVTGIEANTFPANNDFRVIGIARDLRLRSGPIANAAVIDQCTRLTVTGVSGDFIADEIVTGSAIGVKGRLVVFANNTSTRTTGTIKVIRVTSDGIGRGFSVGEVITGATSGKTATVSAVDLPAIRPYLGDILYTENISPVSRLTNQIEDFKFVVKF